MPVLIGTAGWSLPRAEQAEFPGSGSHLERYAQRFGAAEINSSFHRSHRASTWTRWRDSVPTSFRYSVKLPKTITHTARLSGADGLVAAFLKEISSLGDLVGCLLVQLPPSLVFDSHVADEFFAGLRRRAPIALACEPRHESWFGAEADAMFADRGVARVAANPARVPAAAEPGGSRSMSYYRLHGSPKMYYSAYTPDFIAQLAARVRVDSAADGTTWVIFDNTTLGAATRNALDLAAVLS